MTKDMFMNVVKTRTLLYYSFFICLGFVNGIIGPTLPFLSRNLGVSAEKLSFIFVARSLGVLLAALLVSRLFDYFSGHILFCVFIAFGVMSVFVISFSNSFMVVIFMFLLIGLTEGVGHVGGNTLLIWNHCNRTGARINVLHSCHGLGTLIIPLLIGIIAGSIQVGMVYRYVGLVFVPFLFVFALIGSPRNCIRKNTGVKGPKKNILILFVLFIFLSVGVEVSFGNWLSLYATSQGLLEEGEAAYLTSAFWSVFVLGRIAIIPVMKRYGQVKIIIIALPLAMIDTLLFLYARTPSGLWISTVLLAFSLSVLFPSTFSLAERHMSVNGNTVGCFMIATGLGAMVLPWLVGWMFETLGPQFLPLACCFDLFVALLIFFFLLRRFRDAATRLNQAAISGNDMVRCWRTNSSGGSHQIVPYPTREND